MTTCYQRNIPDQPPLWQDDLPYLRFVVKLHQATTLHYDFRLEAFGSLVSWVLPDHPWFDPSESLRASQVGDHDPRWMFSERRIPVGQYGAGPMLVWDEGVYRPQSMGEASHSQRVCEALRRGRLDFELFGKRVRGAFRLQRSGDGWQFRKLPDEYASNVPRLHDVRSIRSGRSLNEIR